jgi:hypothetical protein
MGPRLPAVVSRVQGFLVWDDMPRAVLILVVSLWVILFPIKDSESQLAPPSFCVLRLD